MPVVFTNDVFMSFLFCISKVLNLIQRITLYFNDPLPAGKCTFNKGERKYQIWKCE